MRLYLKTKDYLVSKEEFNLLWDEKRDMLITDPQPKPIEPYYEADNYISHSDADKSFLGQIYYQVKKINLKSKARLIEKLSLGRKDILDIGAGTGSFLLKMKKQGWQVSGIEPNLKAKTIASNKGIHVYSQLKELEGKKFSVITLWHVLEHIPDPEEAVAKIAALMDQNGIVVVAVPNFNSFDAHHYKEFWAAFDVPRHLSHFSKKAIAAIFGTYGFKIKVIKPMLFDSFYISLLSEKYKNGKANYLKSFFMGLRSNLSGLKTGEYSSMLYVLEKAD